MILQAQGAPLGNGMTALLNILPFLMIIAVFYFFLIRPQKKREQQVQEMRNALHVGDQIITIGGIKGRIIRITEDTVVIETSQAKTKMEFIKNAIGQVVSATASTKAEEEINEQEEN